MQSSSSRRSVDTESDDDDTVPFDYIPNNKAGFRRTKVYFTREFLVKDGMWPVFHEHEMNEEKIHPFLKEPQTHLIKLFETKKTNIIDISSDVESEYFVLTPSVLNAIVEELKTVLSTLAELFPKKNAKKSDDRIYPERYQYFWSY